MTTKKKSSDREFELKQGLEQAALAERKEEEQALLKAKEGEAVSGYTEERDLVNQLVGQVQMAQAFSKFTTVVSLSKLQYIKENKLYRVLSGKIADESDEKAPTVSTWDGFCRLLGTTASKVDEDLRNLSVFGEDALNSLNHIGAGYRELRKLRKLPDEERELIINGEAVKAGDKDTLVELIDEMAAKHAREKEALEKQTKDLEGDLEATRRVVEGKNERITELETEAHKRDTMTPDEREADLRERLRIVIEATSAQLLEPRSVIKEIFDWDEAPDSLRHACAEGVTRLFIELEQLRLDYHLPITAPDLVPLRPELVE